MIQYIQCIKAREGMAILDFRERFREYADKMRALGAVSNHADHGSSREQHRIRRIGDRSFPKQVH